MRRDTVKDDQYFDRYLDCQKKRIEKFTDISRTLDSCEVKKIAQCNRYLANYYKDLLSAEYSAGMSKDSMEKTCERYISCVRICGLSDYAEFIDLLSLAILFHMDYETVKDVIRADFSDALTELLCSFLKKEWAMNIECNLLYADYYMPFYQYAIGEIKFADFSAYMTNKWYDTNADMYWYDSHKKKEDIYSGYWCWLAAALMKIRSDVSEIVKFVPMDLI